MKNKLIELIDALREELSPNAYIKIANAIQSLPEDEPDFLPFQWPVKEGYEVVIEAPDSDPRKIVKDVQEPDETEEVACKVDEKWMILETSDLFLRRVEKKVWVVEWKVHNGFSGKNYFDTINEAQELCKRDEKYHSSATIYEATLKPVV